MHSRNIQGQALESTEIAPTVDKKESPARPKFREISCHPILVFLQKPLQPHSISNLPLAKLTAIANVKTRNKNKAAYADQGNSRARRSTIPTTNSRNATQKAKTVAAPGGVRSYFFKAPTNQ
jgi:hypothetical protein